MNIMAIQRFHPGKPLSEMAIHNGTTSLAGLAEMVVTAARN